MTLQEFIQKARNTFNTHGSFAVKDFDTMVQIIELQVEALSRYAGRTVDIKDGRARLNYDGDSDNTGPKMYFYEGDTWIMGDHANKAQSEISKLLETI